MKLRPWQSKCVALAMDHYRTKKHFLCLATPGAGKTTMAAELARQLVLRGDIDFVLCFAPALTVVAGLEQTFSIRLARRFDGRIGAIGGAYTYQGMRTLGDQFWSLLDSHRVLVVFDEIHHCAGSDHGGSNSWGQEILIRIQHKAAFTLALTGTPWRSDNNPIALAKYSDPEGRIQCDYSYGLKDAVKDQVCRKPGIVLIDNERLKLSSAESKQEYEGLDDLFRRSDVRYQHVLHNENALRFCLSLGCSRLDQLRLDSPNAGGLVVASSVEHAKRITYLLKKEFHRSVSLVTYRHKESGLIIDQFRNSAQEWIVSVGMISEGTDIPRLQVCCHLSRITTELYFRQVLGRVLRTTSNSENNAWLYTFAEPMLVEYAQRVAEEVPHEYALSFERFQDDSAMAGDSTSFGTVPLLLADLNCDDGESWQCMPLDATGFSASDFPAESFMHTLECLGAFRQRVVDFFQTDLATEYETT